jgi:hypothetical protein
MLASTLQYWSSEKSLLKTTEILATYRVKSIVDAIGIANYLAR